MESLGIWLSTLPSKGDVLDPFGLFCLLLLVPGFVVCAYLAGPGAERLAKDPIQFAGVRYCASIGLWVFGVGLFFLGARVMQINPLSFGEPKWLLATVVAFVFAAARCVDWWRTDYPAALSRRLAAGAQHSSPDLESRVSTSPVRQSIPQTTVQR